MHREHWHSKIWRSGSVGLAANLEHRYNTRTAGPNTEKMRCFWCPPTVSRNLSKPQTFGYLRYSIMLSDGAQSFVHAPRKTSAPAPAIRKDYCCSPLLLLLLPSTNAASVSLFGARTWSGAEVPLPVQRATKKSSVARACGLWECTQAVLWLKLFCGDQCTLCTTLPPSCVTKSEHRHGAHATQTEQRWRIHINGYDVLWQS
jgi:hypothetical protein